MQENIFRIQGGQPLSGTIQAQRAKNALLPMIAAALIPSEGQTVLFDVPDIADISQAFELARHTGATVDYDHSTGTAVIDASTVNNSVLPVDVTEKFRGSILFLGALISRLGYVELPGSGGCDIGQRKIDFHHRGFARLGADVQYLDDGTTIIDARDGHLHGRLLYLDTPSHTGTENLMMGGALASGRTIIENAAVEPEVADFGRYLQQMGAQIDGLGTPTLTIEGVRSLRAIEYRAIPDRLVVGLLAMTTAAAGGDITIHDAAPHHLRLVNAKLEQMGVQVSVDDDRIRYRRATQTRLAPINITTHPYPGYPTDLQPPIAALATVADGRSYIRERIFENRYDFVDELITMGADVIITQTGVCVISGGGRLQAAEVRAASIRAGAALLVATLAAAGESIITNIYQIDRGHEAIEQQFQQLGGDIVRTTREVQPEEGYALTL